MSRSREIVRPKKQAVRERLGESQKQFGGERLQAQKTVRTRFRKQLEQFGRDYKKAVRERLRDKNEKQFGRDWKNTKKKFGRDCETQNKNNGSGEIRRTKRAVRERFGEQPEQLGRDRENKNTRSGEIARSRTHSSGEIVLTFYKTKQNRERLRTKKSNSGETGRQKEQFGRDCENKKRDRAGEIGRNKRSVRERLQNKKSSSGDVVKTKELGEIGRTKTVRERLREQKKTDWERLREEKQTVGERLG